MGTVNQEKQLERIADALERISEDLNSINYGIERLTECIGYIPPLPHQKEGYRFLRIAGQVDAN